MKETMLVRPRRNRKNAAVRALTQESHLNINDLIAPFFIIEGSEKKDPIPTLPNIFRFTIDQLIQEVEEIHHRGIQSIALFPAIEATKKHPNGSEALNRKGLIPNAVRTLKREFPNLCIITDVALDPYTNHGHDGLIDEQGNILNDETIPILIEQACIAAESGVDIVAPSDMMDGRVEAIRRGLDQKGFQTTSICAYTAKYASALYGPFRDALQSNLSFGDKSTYQINPANTTEALLEARLDQQEGADMLLVKPATFYLDIITKIRQIAHIPVGAYHVSGEYAMVVAAHEKKMLDKYKTLFEALLSIKRAGASFIFTYAFREMLSILGC